MKMEPTECSETSAGGVRKLTPAMKMEQCVPKRRQTPGNNPEERIQHSEHGGCLKSRINLKPSVVLSTYNKCLYAVKLYGCS